MIVLLHGLRAYGAVEHYVAAVVEGLRERGEDALLVYPEDPALEPFGRLAGGSVQTLAFPGALLDSTTSLTRLLVRVLRETRPAIAHVTEVWPQALVSARLARVPRLVVSHHTPELPRRDNPAGRLWWRLGWLTRPEVIYTSETDRQRDGRRLRSYVVPLGIDLARFAHGSPALANGRLIGNVARLAPQKGHRFLIEAAPAVLARHPDARFVIVGDGELREELEQRAREAGVGDSVHFTGARDDVPDLLASFEVFAFPSLFEGLCVAVIEAQAAGVPVVATPVGGIRETVVDGETGFLCPAADPDALAERLVFCLDRPEEAKRVAREASRRVRERFSRERMVEETLRVYAGMR